MKKLILCLFPIVFVLLFAFSTNVFAGDLMGNAQKLLNDVYGKFVASSTAGAGIGVGTGVFMRKFSMGNSNKLNLEEKSLKIPFWAGEFLMALG